ncbi:MAG: ABC transporter ATP-binding protein/permease [Oscillospiraceae bacterium]|nr:ABC transporter ATP-binding protein/permease [Oscillospiraceae bacterium]
MKNVLYFLKFVWLADKRYFIWLLFSFGGQVPYTIMSAMFIKWVMDGVADGSPFAVFVGIALAYALSMLLSNTISYHMYMRRRPIVLMRLERYLSDRLLKKAAKLDAEYFDAPESFDRLSKAVSAMGEEGDALVSMLSNFSSLAVSLSVGAAIIIALNPLFIVLAVAMAFVSFKINQWRAKKQYEYNEAVTPAVRRTQYFKALFFQRDTMADIKQYFSLGKLLFRKYDDALAEQQGLQREQNLKNLKASMSESVFSILLTWSIPYMYLMYFMYAGTITIGDMTALAASFALVTNAFQNTSEYLGIIKQSSMFIRHIRDIFEYEPKIEATEGVELHNVESIEFEKVSFKYPNAEKHVLNDVSFTIRRGEKFALVGVNGAGKTTIVRLMMRFYDPDKGSVKINGRDVRKYDILSLRNAMTSVFQEFQEYSLRISEFVSCCESGAIDEPKVRNALERVGLLDKVLEGSNGIHTEYTKLFDEDGLVFSGGQLQKLIIARMLYKDSAVVIMDEPSSALDPESEYEINRSIAHAAKDKTVVMISHRLSSTRDADSIVLIEGGAVQEQGTHEELLARGGRYASLFNMQASGYDRLVR